MIDNSVTVYSPSTDLNQANAFATIQFVKEDGLDVVEIIVEAQDDSEEVRIQIPLSVFPAFMSALNYMEGIADR